MQRVCFQLQVRPDRIEEYRSRHAAVWPDMLRALADSGWHNYSLFLREDGLLIGYVETPSLAEARAAMAATDGQRPVAGRDERSSSSSWAMPVPDTGFVQLEEVFHLEDQLGGAATQHRRTETR